MIKTQIINELHKALLKMNIDNVIITLDTPSKPEHGDYATSIALKLTKLLKKSPFEIAEQIIALLPKKMVYVEKIKVVKPGFINIWIQSSYYFAEMKNLANDIFIIPTFHFGPEKKIMVEFAHPNTLKLIHIGHMRNLSTGESIARLLEAVGNKVIRTNYQGDVGLHIAKTIWKMQHFIASMGKTKIESLLLRDKIALLGKAYAEAEKAYSTDEQSKKEILEVNRMVYEEDVKIMPLWEETRKWSLQYFNETYKRVYSHHDRLYFESECHKRGAIIAQEQLKKGLLEKSEGAIVFKGEKYGVDTRVFINSLGFPTYEGKELALAEMEFSEFGNLDKNIHVVTPEQTSFFHVTFKVEELIDPVKYKNKQYHLAYNWVKLKQGKMSSRLGNVIEGSWLIDEAKKRLKTKFSLDEQTAEILSVASVKYSFLKVSTSMEIFFDFDESISLDGNSAPYLIYTYVRTQSVLKKSKAELKSNSNTPQITTEKTLMRKLNQFSEKVYEAASQLSPNILCTFLFELAQEYNLFYQLNPILKSEGDIRLIRLLLTQATGQTLKKGLDLLGIKTVEKM